ncbi:hypothetical protein L873DRAFT_1799210 [Choiromyces venosus 120613-1]|uniref:Uncharacterized protein n=1 Tax=Choiromyces venosus 120613-1 TaxID=1336337 RepID=A0A3N4K192_9PEZI|nr:hypothetical protein L873DRAFT_1799210 [Choiromyces venosus 120613-1]
MAFLLIVYLQTYKAQLIASDPTTALTLPNLYPTLHPTAHYHTTHRLQPTPATIPQPTHSITAFQLHNTKPPQPLHPAQAAQHSTSPSAYHIP